MVAVSRREILVRFPGREALENACFEAERPLSVQLQGFCALRGIPELDRNDDCFVLAVAGQNFQDDSTCAVVGDFGTLASLPLNSACSVLSGIQIAGQLLSRIRGASPSCRNSLSNLHCAAQDLLQSIQGNSWFAEEIIAQDGVQILFDALLDAHLAGSQEDIALEITDIVSACIGELLQYENGVASCEMTAEETLTPDSFAILLWAMMADWPRGLTMLHPRAVLALLLSMLIEFPIIAVARIHHAACYSSVENSMYSKLVIAIDEPDDWRSGAAIALLCALFDAAEDTRQMADHVRVAVMTAAKESKDDVAHFLQSLADQKHIRQTCWTRQLLADVSGATSQARSNKIGFSRPEERAHASQDALPIEDNVWRMRTQKLEDQVRRMNQAMRKMAKLVDVGPHPVIKQSLQAICRFGFDSVKWKDGCTALHYAARYVDDLDIVELCCLLSPNPDARDDKGRTPMDYANAAGKEDVALLIGDARFKQEERDRTATNSLVGGRRVSFNMSDVIICERDDAGEHMAEGSATSGEDLEAQQILPVQAVQSLNSRLAKEALTSIAADLHGHLHKYPTSGRGFWKITQKRFFSLEYVPLPPRGKRDPHFALKYWESEEQSMEGAEPKGNIDADHIEEVCEDIDGNTNEAIFGIRYAEEGNTKELVVVAKDAWGMPSAKEARRWIEGLRNFLAALVEHRRRGARHSVDVIDVPDSSDPLPDIAQTDHTCSAPPKPLVPPVDFNALRSQSENDDTAQVNGDGVSQLVSPRGARSVRRKARVARTDGNEFERKDGEDAKAQTASHAAVSTAQGIPLETYLIGSFAEVGPEKFRIGSFSHDPGRDTQRHSSSLTDLFEGERWNEPSQGRSSLTELYEDVRWVEDFKVTLLDEPLDLFNGVSFKPLTNPVSKAGNGPPAFHGQNDSTSIGGKSAVVFSDGHNLVTADAVRGPTHKVEASSHVGYGAAAVRAVSTETRGKTSCSGCVRFCEPTEAAGASDSASVVLKKDASASLAVADVVQCGSGDDGRINRNGASRSASEDSSARTGQATRQRDAETTLGSARMRHGGPATASDDVSRTALSEPSCLSPAAHSVKEDFISDVCQESTKGTGTANAMETIDATRRPGRGNHSGGCGGGTDADNDGARGHACGGSATGGTGVVLRSGACDGGGTGGAGGTAAIDGASVCIRALEGHAHGVSGDGGRANGLIVHDSDSSMAQRIGAMSAAPPHAAKELSCKDTQGASQHASSRQGNASGDSDALNTATKGDTSKIPGESAKDSAGKEQAAVKGKGAKAPPPAKSKGKGGIEGKDGKGSKGSGQEALRKQKFTPVKSMKPVWWQRLLYGKDLKDGVTIWDKVSEDAITLPVQTLLERFCKRDTGPASKKSHNRQAAKKELKQLRIITDSNLVVGKEAALRGAQLPSAEALAQALLQMNPAVLTPHRLAVIKDHACPNPAQVTQLEECRKDNPGVPFAAPEEVMWHVSRVPAYQARVECWYFVRNYEEEASHCARMLEQFQRIMDAIFQSESLPSLLSVVLSVGNFLNGGTNRGQADGFDMEALSKLDAVKDNVHEGKDVRHFIMETIFVHSESVYYAGKDGDSLGERLVNELRLVFQNMSRAIGRDSDGIIKVTKNVRTSLEDAEESVRVLVDEYTARDKQLKSCLETCDDPTDPLRLMLVEQYVHAGQMLGRLRDQASRCRSQFTRILEYFHHKGMKTSEFFLLWDNFFVAPDVMANKPEGVQRRDIVPRFCRPDVEVVADDIVMLWGLEAAAGVKRRGPKKRPARRNSVRIVAASASRSGRPRAATAAAAARAAALIAAGPESQTGPQSHAARLAVARMALQWRYHAIKSRKDPGSQPGDAPAAI